MKIDYRKFADRLLELSHEKAAASKWNIKQINKQMIKVVSTVCLNFNQLEDVHSLQRVKDNFSWQSQSQLLEPEIAEFLFKNTFCQHRDQEIGNGKYFC